ncbi:DUF302 domain-containing protein [Bacteroidales bacterium]
MNMFIKSESIHNLNSTVEIIEKSLLESNWKIMHTHNLHQSLKNHGFDVLPVVVMEVCRPDYSVKMLSLDEERLFSSLMPCRISVYETSDGKTWISRMNSGEIAREAGGITEEVMTIAFNEIEKIVAPITK